MANRIVTASTLGALAAFVAGLATWLNGLRGAAELRAKSPNQREDIGLTLADLQRLA